jgi:exopolyphosphatase/guanosine-5'-triphosphate,3'-diphosphate pyrophosphatase
VGGAGAGADGSAYEARLPRLVGVAGTITTLACLDAEAEVYTPELVHLRRLSRQAVEGLAARLGGMTTADRAALPCVQAGRAAVIVGGALIVKEAMQVLGYPELVVSERDLLDGLVLLGTS